MIKPLSVSMMSAPIAPKFSVIIAIRSDSFTRSSCASLIMVCPFAKHAIRAMTGSSSIRVGIISPSTIVPRRLLVFTRRSATGSPPSSLAFNNVISAPISWHTFKIPARVSLIPTLFIVISEFGVIRAATIKKAAEEISPGTSMCCPCKVSGGVMVQVFLSDTILAPKERSMRSV